MDLVFGFLLGLVASYLVWLYVAKGMVPKIDFSEFVSRQPDDGDSDGFKHRVKIQNRGRRQAVDVETLVELVLYGIQKHSPTTSYTVQLNHSWARIPVMQRKTGNRLIRIDPAGTPDFRELRFPKYIRERAAAGALTLEDVMAIGTAPAWLRVTVFAYDSFSGSRCYYRSRKYYANHIKDRPFVAKGLALAEPID